MKKFTGKAIGLLVCLFVVISLSLSNLQVYGGTTPAVLADSAVVDTAIVPVSLEDLVSNPFSTFFNSLGILVGLILVVFQFINDKILKYAANKQWTMVLTWVLALILAYIGYFFKFGIFVDLQLWEAMLTGIAAGLVANGLFRLSFVKAILKFLQIMSNYKKIDLGTIK